MTRQNPQHIITNEKPHSLTPQTHRTTPLTMELAVTIGAEPTLDSLIITYGRSSAVTSPLDASPSCPSLAYKLLQRDSRGENTHSKSNTKLHQLTAVTVEYMRIQTYVDARRVRNRVGSSSLQVSVLLLLFLLQLHLLPFLSSQHRY
jgi:hypothetical protein